MARRGAAPPEAASPPVAVVTGANRGLGREVCRQLAAQGWRVWLTARGAGPARAAAAELSTALHRAGSAGGSVHAATLDVSDEASVAALAAALKAQGRPLAALINNAGVALDGFNADVVRRTLAVNFHGAARVTEALAPLLAPRGCIVMVSSGMGELAGFGTALRQRFLAPGLTRAELQALLDEFAAAVERGQERAQGWPRSAYSVSKAALNALTRMLARELGPHGPNGPRVNAVCPGWVRTEMGGRGATRGVATGARGIVWAATLPPEGPSGGFFRDGKPIGW